MGKRNLTWLRQHTNVEDLLDDGIDNNSDLNSFAPPDEPSAESPRPEPAAPSSLESRSEADTPESAERDFFVAALAILIIGLGLDLILYPVDMVVYHVRSIEHVTSVGSQFYGCVGILFGAALLIYALKKPRN